MKKFFIGLIGLASLSLYSCSDDDNSNNATTAKLNIHLTDAPADYQEVNIQVTGVSINAQGDEEEGEENGWQEMQGVQDKVYNILELTGGTDVLLASEDIPAGKISQIRLLLGDNNSLLVDDVSHDLKVPSGQASGLKINLHETLEAGVSYKIVLDFDASKSIVEKGNGSYSLKPVIRAYSEAQSGAIKGQVSPVTSSIAYAIIGTDTLASAYTDDEGVFLLKGIEPNIYRVAIDPSTESNYSSASIENIEVVLGDVKDMGEITIQ